MMRLRVHHLFCSALYVGKGYSEGFCENMQNTVQWLWESSPREKTERSVELIAGPDNVCRECPNLSEEKCVLDENHVVSKDIRLARALRLETERTYSVLELLTQVSENLTAELFEESCRKCEWYQMGLCHYEDLADRYQRILPKLSLDI